MCNVLTDQRVIPFQSGTGSSLIVFMKFLKRRKIFESPKLGPVQLTFTSDGGVAQRGFRVTYQIIRPDPCLEEPCQNGAECAQASL